VDAADPRTPVTILAGFLGAGKTTLLNRILSADHGRRVAVIVNDFGSINVDSRLVVARDAEMIALQNGCVCCTLGTDLVGQLCRLLEGPARPEQVLIECSGVSDPGRILVTLHDPYVRRLARVDGVLTLVDAAGFPEVPPSMHELACRQLAAADVIVLNKTDLVSAGELASLRRRLLYPRARVVEAAHADVPLEIALGVGGHDPSSLAAPAHDHEHASAVTWSWSAAEPLRLEALRHVLQALPEGVYRAKGVADLVESPAEQVAVHVVGRRVELRPVAPWDGRPRETVLVFVSLDGRLDADHLAARLAACVAPGPGRSAMARQRTDLCPGETFERAPGDAGVGPSDRAIATHWPPTARLDFETAPALRASRIRPAEALRYQ
jgi:G3E family GTPase